jgi:hypothetical protein
MLREIEKKQLISKFQAAEAYNDQLATPWSVNILTHYRR